MRSTLNASRCSNTPLWCRGLPFHWRKCKAWSLLNSGLLCVVMLSLWRRAHHFSSCESNAHKTRIPDPLETRLHNIGARMCTSTEVSVLCLRPRDRLSQKTKENIRCTFACACMCMRLNIDFIHPSKHPVLSLSVLSLDAQSRTHTRAHAHPRSLAHPPTHTHTHTQESDRRRSSQKQRRQSTRWMAPKGGAH